MDCLEALNISVGEARASGTGAVVAVIGSGGKSTLLRTLAREAGERGARVVLATTTHFLAFEGIALVTSGDMGDVVRALDEAGTVCVGTPTGDALGRLGAPAFSMGKLARAADLVLVEADGSKRLPLKAHAGHEPVVPAEATLTVAVMGANGFGGRVGNVVHRAELLCERLGCDANDEATPELMARSMTDEIARGLIAPTHVIVNQAEGAECLAAARRFAAALREQGCEPPVFLGSIRDGRLERA
ncbi:selenium cofactor biosynthesis protein YqeC [uncultured Parolsenella sp.]|uniref:selenium cofactor biosynthesis protein YqeC n=1 Tax=uncultured Parolsenella sp. TaxID=2083008 RepID=UPI0027DB26B5|nr:selenium cofactor biosynthesis protein YqeC [uncultured Parolsenella sp.]